MYYDRERCITYFTQKYDYMTATDVGLLFDIASDIYIQLRYPFSKVYSISEVDLNKHPTWFLRCIQEQIDKDGISNVVGYSENGVSVTFDKTGLSQALMDEIISVAGVR